MFLFSVKMVLTALVVAAFSLPLLYPSLGSGLLEELETFGYAGAAAVFATFLVFVFFYCKDLQKTLELISPGNRASKPNSVWLMFLIPYNFVEDFFIINNVSKSVKDESKTNPALGHLRYFGYYSGIGWCAAQIVSLAPGYIGKSASLVAIVLWIVHWHFIRSIRNALKKS